MSRFVVLLVLASLSAAAFAAPILPAPASVDENVLPRPGVQSVEVDHVTVPPPIHTPLSGDIVTLPKTMEVYYDRTIYVPSTIEVTISTSRGETRDCSDLLQIWPEYATFSVQICAGDLLATSNQAYLTNVAIQRRTGTFDSRSFSWTYLPNVNNPWPLENDKRGWPPTEPNLVGNIMENYQSFSGAASAYWHQGFDIRSVLEPTGNVAGVLRTPVDGTVVQFIKYSTSDLYWSFMVRDAYGFIWQFHHLDPKTIRLRIGDTVRRGDVIGNIIYWPSSFNGALYHHVHMNVVRPHPSWTSIPAPYVDGWQYFNPFSFLAQGNYTNFENPTSDGVMYFLDNGSTDAYAATSSATKPVVRGKVDIIVNLSSLFTKTNSVPGHPYTNGLYEVGYSISSVSGNLLFKDYLIRMDRLPNQWPDVLPDLKGSVLDSLLRFVYAQSFRYQGATRRSVFDYNNRVLYYIVTNSFRGQPDANNGYWNTQDTLENGSARFPNGNYVVTVFASDWYGKQYSLSKEVTVQN